MLENLTSEIARQHAGRLTQLANLIPEVTYSTDDILAETKSDGRDISSKWQHSYLLKEEGEIIGFIMGYIRAAENNGHYPTESLYMSELAVDPSRRGKGYAKKLVAHYLKEGLADGVEKFTLQTNAAGWNEPARRLYKKFGFREDSIKEYDNRRDVIMRADGKDIRPEV